MTKEEIRFRLKECPLGMRVRVVSMMLCEPKGTGHNARQWTSASCEPFEAWICGATRVCDGYVEQDSYPGNPFEGEHDYQDVYFVATKRTPAFRVRQALFGKEILVPLDGVEPLPCHPGVPGSFTSMAAHLYVPPLPNDHWYRAIARKEMADWPRDEKGRWVKK